MLLDLLLPYGEYEGNRMLDTERLLDMDRLIGLRDLDLEEMIRLRDRERGIFE